MPARRPKHCPKCGSSRIHVKGSKFSCKACDYVNDAKPAESPEFVTYRRR